MFVTARKLASQRLSVLLCLSRSRYAACRHDDPQYLLFSRASRLTKRSSQCSHCPIYWVGSSSTNTSSVISVIRWMRSSQRGNPVVPRHPTGTLESLRASCGTGCCLCARRTFSQHCCLRRRSGLSPAIGARKVSLLREIPMWFRVALVVHVVMFLFVIPISSRDPPNVIYLFAQLSKLDIRTVFLPQRDCLR